MNGPRCTKDGFCNTGAYNLGFLALRSTPEVQRICRWWGRRLQTECLIDLNRGLFVDQKWADLFPSFIEKTHILRHPGYNVAYWNLSQRRVTFERDAWLVNGLPLRFFHFSGSVISAPSVFSRHSSFYVKGGLRALDRLFEDYCALVRQNGLTHYQREYPFSFNWSGPTGKNEHTPVDASGSNQKGAMERASIFSETNFPHLPLMVAASRNEFFLKKASIDNIDAERRKIEDVLVPAKDLFLVHAYCVVCGKPGDLRCHPCTPPEHLRTACYPELARAS